MCIFAYSHMPYLPCHYLYISFILLHLLSTNISVLNLAIFPYCSEGEDGLEFFDEEY
jgi:hypothetical protein